MGRREVPVDIEEVEEVAEPVNKIVINELDAERCVCCLQ